jgi:hypothetical protein
MTTRGITMKKREPKLDYYPDGWGMKIDSESELEPDESRKLIDAIEESRKSDKKEN